jgi:hypothetical protein
MIGKILIAGWIFIVASILIFFAFPKLLTMIPHLANARFFLEPFMFFTIAYRVAALYRRGIKRANRD